MLMSAAKIVAIKCDGPVACSASVDVSANSFLESEREPLGPPQMVTKTNLLLTWLSCSPGLVLLKLHETNSKLRRKLGWRDTYCNTMPKSVQLLSRNCVDDSLVRL